VIVETEDNDVAIVIKSKEHDTQVRQHIFVNPCMTVRGNDIEFANCKDIVSCDCQAGIDKRMNDSVGVRFHEFDDSSDAIVLGRNYRCT
jgi:hypothetical protein